MGVRDAAERRRAQPRGLTARGIAGAQRVHVARPARPRAPASAISSTFSAFVSPERDEVERSRRNTDVVGRPVSFGVHVVVRRRPARRACCACRVKAARQRSSSGAFQRERGLTRATRREDLRRPCVASHSAGHVDALLARPPSASVPQDRRRRSSSRGGDAHAPTGGADPLRDRGARAPASRPGQNARAARRPTGGVSKSARRRRRGPRPTAGAKLRAYGGGHGAGTRALAVTFSCRRPGVHGSSSASPSRPPGRRARRTCGASGRASRGSARSGTPSVSRIDGSVCGGAGKNGRSSGSGSSWLKAIRTRTPRADRGAQRRPRRDRRPRPAGARRRVRGRGSRSAPESQASSRSATAPAGCRRHR